MERNKGLFELALVAPPWWLIPSKNIVTATEHLVEDYSYNFNKEGYKSVVFSRRKDNTDIEDIKDLNKYKNTYIYTKVTFVDRKLFRNINSLFFYFLYILKVSFKIKKLGIRKIIVFQILPFCFWIKLINTNSKILYHIGNHELSKSENYYQYGFIPSSLALKVFPKIYTIIPVSNHIRDGIVKRFPSIKNKCKTIYVGIDSEIFKKGEKDKRKRIITYSGRVVPEKGVHLLVNVFNNLKKDFKDIELYILGSGIGPNIPFDYFDIFKKEGIKMLGLLPRKDVANILRQSSIFVYPVIWEEPFGLAPVEAMAVGIPTVVSNTKSGYTEIINDSNGYYFNSNDEKDLERVLKGLLSSSNGQKDICNKAVETIQKRLSWKDCIKNSIDCFTQP
ncbi:MAG: Glycosyltransferase [candidate division WS6 bacterium GW2011_GWB1_33_6]|uniref:Glycosyltransferase n=1 Tax=candidate division WS6 bacterium GW2011_GWB1_33_6 TaxID=1619088 RepID=A0A0G0ADX9_9BACT|nr:MAG: Glycosyltransferase [candidate division WS6 bacterium GW2011_GWB1_33_6]